jgi:protein-disulfide isomerase
VKVTIQVALRAGYCAVIAAVAAALVGAASPARPATGDDSNKTVAIVGSRQITQAELDARTKVAVERMRAQMQKHLEESLAEQTAALKHHALRRMAEEYLVEDAAQRQNLSVPDFLKKSAAESAITDAQARQYYQQNRMQRLGSFEQVKPRIVDIIARKALLARLRRDEPVRILLQPKRVAVDSSGHPALGPASAPITIVEFSDFQCPFCRATEPTLKELRSKYGDKIRLVYMDYPLPMHAHALDAARAARCAGEQGKFWPYHDALFADQQKLSPADLKATAQTLGLDTGKFDGCLDQSKYTEQVNHDEAQGKQIGINGTPGFFVNGRLISGAQKADVFEEMIDDDLSNGAHGQHAAR